MAIIIIKDNAVHRLFEADGQISTFILSERANPIYVADK